MTFMAVGPKEIMLVPRWEEPLGRLITDPGWAEDSRSNKGGLLPVATSTVIHSISSVERDLGLLLAVEGSQAGEL